MNMRFEHGGGARASFADPSLPLKLFSILLAVAMVSLPFSLFEESDAVTVDRLNGMITGGVPQDPLDGTVIIDENNAMAFDGAYIEVGTRLVLNGPFDVSSGFGLSSWSSGYQGILTHTGDIQITGEMLLMGYTITMHVVDPVESDVTYSGLQDFYFESEYTGYSTPVQYMVVYRGQYVNINCFVGTTDGLATADGPNPFLIGDNGLVYGTASTTGFYTFQMVETDDAHMFALYISVIEEEHLTVEADMDDGSEPITLVDARVFGDSYLVFNGIVVEAPDTERDGYTFLRWTTPTGFYVLDYTDYNGSICILPPSTGTYTITAVWEQNAISLVFESDPVTDGILIPPGHHLITLLDFYGTVVGHIVVEHGHVLLYSELPPCDPILNWAIDGNSFEEHVVTGDIVIQMENIEHDGGGN